MNRYIYPSALNILGGEQTPPTQTSDEQCDFTPEQTWKDKIKSSAKKVFGFLKRALDYIKEVVVPVVTAASGILNAWSNFRRYSESGRSVAWSA